MSALNFGTTMRRFRHAFPLLVALAAMALPSASSAQIVDVTVAIAPPELPLYDQPEIPGPGYIWTPGFWAYGPDGYYWVPGTWVEPPTVGLLWTPGYWGWRDGLYVWHAGYWGPHIGYYGGINYGFGYVGSGYEGGYWRDGVFSYNTTVNNFGSVHITNVYNKTIVHNTAVARVSFNGGTGGTVARPTPQEETWAHEQHIPPTTTQTQHVQAASTNHSLLASVNHGKPVIAATSKPGDFSGHGVVGTKDLKPEGPGGPGQASTEGGPGGPGKPHGHGGPGGPGFPKGPGVQVDRVVLVGRARRPRKADQVVQGNRMGMADRVAPVFRKDLEVQVDRVVLVGRARLPRKADQVVQGNRMGMADRVAPVFREDLQVQVDRVVLVGRARPPTKQGPLVVLAKVAKGADARKTPTCLAANSSCAWVGKRVLSRNIHIGE